MKTSNLAIAISFAVIAVVALVFAIMMLTILLKELKVVTKPPCETKTFEAYGRVLKPLDYIILWSFDLTWMETGTARLYIRADISSDVPVILAASGLPVILLAGVGDEHSDSTDIVFSTEPSTRIVGYYSVDLDKGFYGVLLENPNDVHARIDGEIELTLCTPSRGWSKSMVWLTAGVAVFVAAFVMAIVGLFLWYTEWRHPRGAQNLANETARFVVLLFKKKLRDRGDGEFGGELNDIPGQKHSTPPRIGVFNPLNDGARERNRAAHATRELMAMYIFDQKN